MKPLKVNFSTVVPTWLSPFNLHSYSWFGIWDVERLGGKGAWVRGREGEERAWNHARKEAHCLSSSGCLRTARSRGTAEAHGSLITERHIQLIFRDRLDLPFPKPKAGKLPYLSLFNTLNITSRPRKKYWIWLSSSQTQLSVALSHTLPLSVSPFSPFSLRHLHPQALWN